MYIRKKAKQYRQSLSENEARILSDLAYRGKGIFNLNDMERYVKEPKNLLYRLQKKNWILKIKQGLYMIAPLEAGELGAGAFTVHNFLIASHLVDPYYIGYWSALNYHGLTDQTPTAVYVATTKPRHNKRILDSQFVFVCIPKNKFFGITDVEVEKKPIKISDVEKTIVDCLDHPEHCGGIDNIAKAIYFEYDSLDIDKVLQYAHKMRNKTILKRLGYLLEVTGHKDDSNLISKEDLSKGYSLLDPSIKLKGKINEKWRLRINQEIKVGS